MLNDNSGAAAASTGLVAGDDPARGMFPCAEIERLAFLKHSAVNRIQASSRRSWSMVLQESVAIFNFNLRPGAAEAAGGEGGDSPFAPSRNGDTARVNPHAP